MKKYFKRLLLSLINKDFKKRRNSFKKPKHTGGGVLKTLKKQNKWKLKNL